jgi:SAM-dependent methyltransferase
VETQVHVSDTSAPLSYFDRAYRDYEAQNPPRKTDHYLDQVEALVTPGRHDMLDVGCGLGSFLRRATERLPEWGLSGSDIELSAVETTQQLVPAATIVRASATESPFPAGSFDVITAWDVIEHVPDRDAVAASVSQMLRPGGLFLFVVPVYDGILGPVIRRLDRDPTHVHKEGRRFWLDWASTSFEVLEWHGMFRYLLGRYYVHIPTRRLRSNATAILVVCRSPR